MKQIKRKISIVLIVALLLLPFGALLNARAATQTTKGVTYDDATTKTGDSASYLVTGTGTITVNNVAAGDTFAAYKIVNAYYNPSINQITYAFTSDFQAFLTSTANTAHDYSAFTVAQYVDDVTNGLVSGNLSNGSVETTAQTGTTLDTIASAYAGYIKGGATLTNSPSSYALTTSSTTATCTAPSGSYLILPTSASKVYAVMVGNVEYVPDTNDSTAWSLNSPTINAKSSLPGITANLETSYSEYSYKTSFDTIHISVNATLPTYPTNATNKSYVVEVDSTADGKYNNYAVASVTDTGNKTFVIDGADIKVNNTTVATIATVSNKITITFDSAAIADFGNDTVTFNITATLDNTASVTGTQQGNTGGHDTIAKLTYANEPYGTGTDTDTVTLTAFTYGLNIYLKDSSDNTKALGGAEYSICLDNAGTNCLNGVTLTTDSNGFATYKGLASGTYYLKQTKAPSGYSLDASPDPVVIQLTGAVADSDTTNYDGYYVANLVNSTSAGLPFTGGIGTIIYTMLGLLVIALSILLISASKNKKENKVEA